MKKLSKFWRMRRLRRGGFSLLDVLVGMVILALALFSALALASNNARLVSANQNVAAASLLSQNKMEELRNATYATLASGADPGTLNPQGGATGIFTRSWTVTNDSPMVGMKTIVVTVAWNQWGDNRSYILHGEVAQP